MLDFLKKLISGTALNPLTTSSKKQKFYNPIKDPVFVNLFQQAVNNEQKRLLELMGKRGTFEPTDAEIIIPLLRQASECAKALDCDDHTMKTIKASNEWHEIALKVKPFHDKYCREKVNA